MTFVRQLVANNKTGLTGLRVDAQKIYTTYEEYNSSSGFVGFDNIGRSMTSNGQRTDGIYECAPPSDRCLHPHQAVEDLIELNGLDDEAVIENLRTRFLAGTPYTGAGSVMVALNPCRNIVEVYDRDMQVKWSLSAVGKGAVHSSWGFGGYPRENPSP